MKKLFLSLLLFFFSFQPVFAARLWTMGFEGRDVTSGVEWNTTVTGGTGGAVTSDTTTFRSGAAALRVQSADDGSNYLEYIGRSTADVLSFRAYLRCASFLVIHTAQLLNWCRDQLFSVQLP
jgi:hypothetical protein